jgi:hypothetical protein
MLWLLCILIGLVLGQFITIKIDPQAQEWVLINVPKLVERFTTDAAPLIEGWRERAMIAEIQKAHRLTGIRSSDGGAK